MIFPATPVGIPQRNLGRVLIISEKYPGKFHEEILEKKNTRSVSWKFSRKMTPIKFLLRNSRMNSESHKETLGESLKRAIGKFLVKHVKRF